MATSGTTAFESSFDILEMIEEAYERLGADPRNGYDLKTARRSLDLLTKEWANRGINLWTIKESTESVLADATTTTLDSDAMDVLDCVWRTGSGSSQQDQILTRMSMPEWAHIANKNQTAAKPTRFWVNRVTGAPVMYLWPVPSEAGTLVYWKLRRIEDVGTYTNTMDIPPRFLPALIAGLAYYLGMKTPSAMAQLPVLQAEYERQFGLAAEEDRERASLWLVPGF